MKFLALGLLCALPFSCEGAANRPAEPGHRPVDFVNVFNDRSKWDARLVAEQMQIEMSRELFDRFTILHAHGVHGLKRVVGGGRTVLTYTNVKGGQDKPLRFEFGKVIALILQKAEIRLNDRGEAHLRVKLSGGVFGDCGGKRVSSKSLRLSAKGWQAAK